VGYLSPMECDITPHVRPDVPLALRLTVNSTHTPEDGLSSVSDLTLDGTNLGGWGGIGDHVRLESRAMKGWIDTPHVRYTLSTNLDTVTINVTVNIGGVSAAFGDAGLELHAVFLNSTNGSVGEAQAHCSTMTCSTQDTTLKSPALWSPHSPVQYAALIQLLDSSGKVVDDDLVRFGFKKIEIIDYHWKLNGEWLFLHGYGDDSIFPWSLAPHTNRSLYAQDLKQAKSLGFNFVRHHSAVPPAEYFEEACAQGIMVQVEFSLNRCSSSASPAAFYDANWRAVIQKVRNYPCVFDYTMNNECWAEPHAHEWYSIAKELDPPQLVNTCDGINSAMFNWTATPFAFRSASFHHHFKFSGEPAVPVIVHEMGNYLKWPLLDGEIAAFQHNMKPYWLEPVRTRIANLGLLDENEMWSYCSRRLYLFLWKRDLEAVRTNQKIVGYEWWLIYDYWMTANGIFDVYHIPRLPEKELGEIAQMNSAVQLLAAQPGDSLPLPDSTPRLQRSYVSNDTLGTSIHISNYGANDIKGAMLSWQVVALSNGTSPEKAVCAGQGESPVAMRGPGSVLASKVSCPLPDLGNFLSTPKAPQTLALRAQLHAADGTLIATNEWHSRIYARPVRVPVPQGRVVYAKPELCDAIPLLQIHCTIPPSGTAVAPGSVFVVDYIDSALLDFAAAGSTVLLVKGSGQGHGIKLQTEKSSFASAAWFGGNNGINNMGTVVYNTSLSITEGMAPDGWADEGWAELMNGGVNYILDALPGKAEVLIREIDIMSLRGHPKTLQDNPLQLFCRQKALLWQSEIVSRFGTSVSSDKGGTLLAAGFNLLVNNFTASPANVSVPEAAWLLRQLLQHAFSDPKPRAALVASPVSQSSLVDSSRSITQQTGSASSYLI